MKKVFSHVDDRYKSNVLCYQKISKLCEKNCYKNNDNLHRWNWYRKIGEKNWMCIVIAYFKFVTLSLLKTVLVCLYSDVAC